MSAHQAFCGVTDWHQHDLCFSLLVLSLIRKNHLDQNQPACSQVEQKACCQDSIQLFFFLFFKPSSSHMGSFPSCPALTDLSKPWTKPCMTFTSCPSGDFIFPVDVRGSVKMQMKSGFAFLPGVLVALWQSSRRDCDRVGEMTSACFKIVICFFWGVFLHVYPVTFQQSQTNAFHTWAGGGCRVWMKDTGLGRLSQPFLHLKYFIQSRLQENTSSLHTRHRTVCSAALWPLRALVGRQLETPRDILCWTQTKGAEERL